MRPDLAEQLGVPVDGVTGNVGGYSVAKYLANHVVKQINLGNTALTSVEYMLKDDTPAMFRLEQ